MQLDMPSLLKQRCVPSKCSGTILTAHMLIHLMSHPISHPLEVPNMQLACSFVNSTALAQCTALAQFIQHASQCKQSAASLIQKANHWRILKCIGRPGRVLGVLGLLQWAALPPGASLRGVFLASPAISRGLCPAI